MPAAVAETSAARVSTRFRRDTSGHAPWRSGCRSVTQMVRARYPVLYMHDGQNLFDAVVATAAPTGASNRLS